MNQTYRILPVYTSDVSGVCSALYELGGLVVMHDPSGCNSTYNTHDEIRWYEQDSLIFISGLTERDAIMGNDEKFYRDVREAAREFQPAFIAVTNSPIPYLTGTDFPALMRRMEKETGIPSFYVPANGMHDYCMGAGKAFQRVAQRLVDGKYHCPVSGSVNILGITPLDYAAEGSVQALCSAIEDGGFRVNSVWAMGDTLDHIRHAGEAAVNLVVSSSGLMAAQVLKQRFGTPCVVGTPVGGFTRILLDAIETAGRTREDIPAYRNVADNAEGQTKRWKESCSCGCREAAVPDKTGQRAEPSKPGAEVTLVGEPVLMGSLAAAIRLGRGRSTRVLCPTEIYKGLLTDSDKKVYGEEETESLLADAKTVIADPLYQWICPQGGRAKEMRFYPLPSLALSGRIYLKEMLIFSNLEV